jgi:enoyl-CoA hydratase
VEATEASEPSVLTSVEGGIARLTLNNPTRKNAITLEMAQRVIAFCDAVERDESVGAVIIDGASGYFCSGADTRDLASASASPSSPDAVMRTSTTYASFVRIGTLPVPSVAVVAGGAVGAGMNLALAADLMLVTPDARLDPGFVARGIHPGGGHFSLLGRSLSRPQAIALGALGVTITGDDAVRLGLAWAAHPVDSILAAAQALVAQAAGDPALARRVKHSADLELGPSAVSWSAAVEVERGAQMWSLGRKGEAAWARPSAAGNSAD